MIGANPSNPWTIILLIIGALGVGKWVGDGVGRLWNRVQIKRRAEREQEENDQSNSDYWQGQTMTLQGELAKRDEKIQHLEQAQEEMRKDLTELQARFAGVLWENREYREKYGLLQAARSGNG